MKPQALIKTVFDPLIQIAGGMVSLFRRSKVARILLLIVLFKFIVFYGFLKGFLYPRYLKPKWESDEHRSNHVINDLLNRPNTYHYDRDD